MEQTRIYEIAKELNVTIQDVWNVYLNRKVEIDSATREIINDKINERL